MIYKMSERIYELENRGKKIIKLNVGEPDWRPPKRAMRALFDSVKNGKDKYASASGERLLREKIAEVHGCDAKNVVVVPGSKWGIYALMKLHLSPGENSIIFSPHWTAYELISKSLGLNAKIINLKIENNWKPDFEALENTIDSKTKLIIMNSPCNPTSRAWSVNEEKQLFEIAKRKGITVLVDDSYRELCFEKRENRQLEDGMFIANTFSKTFGMTGWRIGYIIVPEAMAKRMVSLNQITISNVPVFLQNAALAAMNERDKVAEKARKLCKKRAELAEKMLAPHMNFSRPNAGFYLFPKLPESIDANVFVDKLLEKYVAVAPGAAFGDYKQHIRISLCREDEILKDALEKIIEVVEECKKNRL